MDSSPHAPVSLNLCVRAASRFLRCWGQRKPRWSIKDLINIRLPVGTAHMARQLDVSLRKLTQLVRSS